ncbi:hypothetical protein FHG64_17085 [Antarcticibacterium flavum]|uniref:Lipocalin family protein n=1 Tax=Antarcticibacterium flavum TaxID=2058175 RepID=A0A5B7X6G2_9FLAO|nr:MULTISPECIES: hypothetical protein [Antarcticibacterium]MCM4159324.1 hypothetical protein [Antarcticibacterium sp. W02-3]QCY70969.1 hypothetical protein FHG64_17085 [Antarcticibacterium flavum]
MKFTAFLACLVILTSCNSKDPEEKIPHLEGYWEIEKVEFSKDSMRTYTFNETVDFLDLENGSGFRKKVKPQLNGSYLVTNDAEQVETIVEDNELFLLYTTPYDTWREKVLKANEDHLQIENERGIIYHYKRFKPLLNNYYEAE